MIPIFFLWTQAQATALRDGKAQELDWANLAEEIESLGKSDRRALGSHLEGLVMHLLKWHYQPSGRATAIAGIAPLPSIAVRSR